MKKDTITADITASFGAKVIPMNEDTWRIEDGEVRLFLLKGTEKALLIDTGMTVWLTKEIGSALTGLPVFLLNTHTDADHIGGNDQFDFLCSCGNPKARTWGLKVWYNELSAQRSDGI